MLRHSGRRSKRARFAKLITIWLPHGQNVAPGGVAAKPSGLSAHCKELPGKSQRQLFPQFGNVSMVAPMWGNSNYQALNIKVQKRFSHGLNFQANYTFSKFIDDVPASFEAGSNGAPPATDNIQNFYNRKLEKALSGNNVPNRFVVTSAYELPLGKGKRWLTSGVTAAALGGWSLALIGALQQGSPMELIAQTNTTNAFTPGGQRVNVLRDPNLPSDLRSVSRWFDTAAVAAPASFTFGDSSRSLVSAPGVLDFSISALKNIRLHERYNVQVRVEALNFLNHPNFNPPGNQLGSSSFGLISSAKDPRIMQLGLRFNF